jgi:hypothetical protein
MKIPEIRVELLAIAEWLDDYAESVSNKHLAHSAARLRLLEKELHRRPPVRRAKVNKTTPPTRLIRAFAEENPDMDYIDMAAAMGIATGRISEALVGKRN